MVHGGIQGSIFRCRFRSSIHGVTTSSKEKRTWNARGDTLSVHRHASVVRVWRGRDGHYVRAATKRDGIPLVCLHRISRRMDEEKEGATLADTAQAPRAADLTQGDARATKVRSASYHRGADAIAEWSVR